MTFVNIAVTSYCLNQGGFMPMETLEKEQFIFANIFIISNRLKTACEKNTNRYNYEAMVNARDFFVYK